MRSPGTLVPRAGIVFLFLISIVFQARFTLDSVRAQTSITESARPPFRIRPIDGVLTALLPEAKAAGISEGDQPISIEGRPLRGNASISEALRKRQAGDLIRVRASHNGIPIAASIRLRAPAERPLTVSEWVVALLLNYMTPWFCITLGFAVAFARPRDPLAWLLALLMLSFSKFGNSAFAPVAQGWGDG